MGEYNVDEMYVFLRIILSVGVIVKTPIEDYWNTTKDVFEIPAGVGIKTYEICETETGYLWRYEVLADKLRINTNIEAPLVGKLFTLMLNLLKDLEYRDHIVWVDYFYKSPALASCTSVDVEMVVLQDKRRVCLMSTYPDDYFVNSKGGKTLGMVHNYNLRMADKKKNQMLAFYQVPRK
ncbi:hypothetical protein EVAR_25413_1 [Eumeta japonica]|uniref:PiggyBac transposable element-derived protein domain-containing protein n=1 Tax=Eumeta variegata TaxID=151549 RepID=A0A4C1V6C4_EUMVA|nr:hypothetical protein EVAR_25413_1 [Eumeta japonica]